MAEQDYTNPQQPQGNEEQELRTSDKATPAEPGLSQAETRNSENIHQGKHVSKPTETVKTAPIAKEETVEEKQASKEEESEQPKQTAEEESTKSTLTASEAAREEATETVKPSGRGEEAATDTTVEKPSVEATTTTSNQPTSTIQQATGQAAAAMAAEESEESAAESAMDNAKDLLDDTGQTSPTTETSSDTSTTTETTTESTSIDTGTETGTETTIIQLPSIVTLDLVANEDTSINTSISLSGETNAEELSVKISGLPESATLSAGSEQNGIWILTPSELEGLTISLPENYSGNFTLNVNLTGTLEDVIQTTSKAFSVDVNPIADTPTLTVSPATGAEDNAIDLDIQSALTDSSEALSISISQLPGGASLSAGTENPDGSWTLTTAQLDGLQLNLPVNYSGEFTLNVTATSAEGESSAATSQNLIVTVDAVADTPTLTVSPAAGAEDNAIDLDIQSALTDASETLSITVSDLPEGSSLSAGSDNGDGSWSLTPDQLDGLQFTPPENYSGEINLLVTAVSSEGDSTANNIATLQVSVDPVADTPVLLTENAVGTQGAPIPLTINSNLMDTDSSESLSILVDGVPDDASLSAGIDNGDGSWSLTPDQLDGLSYIPGDAPGIYDLTVTATATESDDSTASISNNLSINVSVFEGTEGKDVFHGSEYADEIHGLGDVDKLYGEGGEDLIYGDAGNDILIGGADADTIYGGADNDTIKGGTGDDELHGDEGVDIIKGEEGEDTIYGGTDNDKLYGGEDNDELYGESGDDVLHGDAGADTLHGDEGADKLYGDEGADTLHGGLGDDILHGNTEDDTLHGDEGADKLYGDAGADTLYGGADDDILRGNAGDDTLYGDEGADKLYGGEGHDTLSGGAGDDILRGNAGNDVFIFGLDSGHDDVRGGKAGGWTDTIKLNDVSGPPVEEINSSTDWTLNLDKKSADYTIDTENKVIEFQGGEGKGTIELSDGSELSFNQIERIEWE